MLKTSPQFLINQSSKNTLAWVIITWASLFPSLSFAAKQESSSRSLDGLYDSYASILEIDRDNYHKKLTKLKQKPSNLLDLKDLNSIDLDPDFISHVLNYSPARYAYLGLKDECSFYDLILAGVIKDYQGPIDYVIARYISKEGKKRRAWVKLEAYINAVALPRCPKVKSFKLYFTPQNFSKTVKAIKLIPPENIDDCKKVHKEFIDDHKTPYLCGINDQINELPHIENQLSNTSKSNFRLNSILKNKVNTARKYKSKMTKRGLSYLENLCMNIENEKAFCENFFNKNFWSRVVDGEKPEEYMKPICQGILDRKKLIPINYQACLRQINQNKELCRWKGDHFPALLPKPNCDETEFALNYSHLNATYQDCPGQVGNLSVVNVARILRHFRPEKIKDYSFCSLTSASTFLDFNNETIDARTWDLKLCYDDKLNEKEVCLPSLTGDVEDSPFSISTVVSQIMASTKGTSPQMKCKVITNDRYNPSLLEYKDGCFITYDPDKCTAVECKHRIIYNEQIITHIEEKQNMKFDYFPNSFKLEKLSQTNLLREYLQIKSKKIINTTILKLFFKNHPQGIIHAIGCLENIYPEILTRYSFNKCTPTPLIIDGFIEKKGYFSLITRTAMDSLHAPRLVPWYNIFEAVKNYQGFHPLKLWSLYGLYTDK